LTGSFRTFPIERAEVEKADAGNVSTRIYLGVSGVNQPGT
jgi:hypothetical protein